MKLLNFYKAYTVSKLAQFAYSSLPIGKMRKKVGSIKSDIVSKGYLSGDSEIQRRYGRHHMKRADKIQNVLRTR